MCSVLFNKEYLETSSPMCYSKSLDTTSMKLSFCTPQVPIATPVVEVPESHCIEFQL